MGGARTRIAVATLAAWLLVSGAHASVQSNAVIAQAIKADVAAIVAGINAHDVARATQFDASDIISMESGRPPLPIQIAARQNTSQTSRSG